MGGGAVAAEGGCIHDETCGTSFTFLSSSVPDSWSIADNTLSKEVQVGSCSWAEASESGWVIDQMRRAGNAGLDLGVPDSGGSTLDAIT